MPTANSPQHIQPKKVRYIKLGEGGAWEQECLDRGILRFGYDSGDPETMALCRQCDWDALAESWRLSGKSQSTATRFANETKMFFEDCGDTLWITFIGERLCWGFLAPGEPQRFATDDNSSWRQVVGGWRHTDLLGEELSKTRLSGSINKLAAYRGTSCGVDVADRLVARINGKKTPEIELAINRLSVLCEALGPLIQMLGPKDFEILVDLIFSASGWRRVGSVGSTQRTLDIDMELPTTRERAFVQVKCSTNQKQFDDYLERKQSLDTYDRMFFVFHTGTVRCHDPRAIVIGLEQLSALVVNAGLTDWVIQKAT